MLSKPTYPSIQRILHLMHVTRKISFDSICKTKTLIVIWTILFFVIYILNILIYNTHLLSFIFDFLLWDRFMPIFPHLGSTWMLPDSGVSLIIILLCLYTTRRKWLGNMHFPQDIRSLLLLNRRTARRSNIYKDNFVLLHPLRFF